MCEVFKVILLLFAAVLVVTSPFFWAAFGLAVGLLVPMFALTIAFMPLILVFAVPFVIAGVFIKLSLLAVKGILLSVFLLVLFAVAVICGLVCLPMCLIL